MALTLPLTAAQRLTIGWVLILLAAYTVLALWDRHLQHNRLRRVQGQPAKTALQHLQTHAVHHGAAGVVAALGVSLLLGAGAAYVLLHHGGAVFHPQRHITPPVRHVGGAGAAAGADLTRYIRASDVVDQDGTNACCGITTVRLDTLQRTIRDGEYPAPDAPLSGYRPWWYATGGQNVGTDPVDDLAALNGHGAEALAYWGPHGYPDASDALHTIHMAGGSMAWDYSQQNGGGRAGLDDVEWRLDHKTPVGLLWAVHQDGEAAAAGQAYTWDGGGFVFWHCLVAIAWTPHGPGGIGEAMEVWNSWGPSWGQGGQIWLPAAVVESHIAGAFVETPGPAVHAWLPPPPPTPVPTPPTNRPPPPTKTPPPHSSTHPPVACVSKTLRLAHAANLHSRPV